MTADHCRARVNLVLRVVLLHALPVLLLISEQQSERNRVDAAPAARVSDSASAQLAARLAQLTSSGPQEPERPRKIKEIFHQSLPKSAIQTYSYKDANYEPGTLQSAVEGVGPGERPAKRTKYGANKGKKLGRVASSGHQIHQFQRIDEPTEESSEDNNYYDNDRANIRDDRDEQEDSPPSRTTTTTTMRPQKLVARSTRAPSSQVAGQRSARTATVRTTVSLRQVVAPRSKQQEHEKKKNTRPHPHAVYDLTGERTSGGSVTTSEHLTNYSSSSAPPQPPPPTTQIAKFSFSDSKRLSGNAKSSLGSRTQDGATASANATTTKNRNPDDDHHSNDLNRNQTSKTSTKRRDTWDKMRARPIPAPLIQLEFPPPSLSTMLMTSSNRMQPKQDSGPTTSFQSYQQRSSPTNASQQSMHHFSLPLPLGNYINGQQQVVVGGSPKTSEDKMSIVRSGFLVPPTFGASTSSGSLAPTHSLRALAPAAMALLAHAHNHQQDSSAVPGAKQLRALSQLRALLSLHPASPASVSRLPQQQQQQPVESLMPMASVNLMMPGNLTGGGVGQLQVPPSATEQMVATSNQLGVSHLAASEPSGSYNALAASMQDYHQQQRPGNPTGGGGDGHHSDPTSARPPPPQDSLNGGESEDSASGRGPVAHHQSDREGGGGGGHGGGYGGQGASDDGYSQGHSGGHNNQDGAPPAHYSHNGRAGANSSSGSGGGGGGSDDYYTNSRISQSGPGPSTDHYGAASKHRSVDMMGNNGDLDNSLRSSLDTYEDYIGSPQSTSDFVQDLADLDDEFNRHAIFGSGGGRSVSSGGSGGQDRPSSRDEYTASTGHGLMSDSVISYSPQRYQTIRHYQRPSGGGDYLSAAGSMANIIPRPYSGGGGGHHHHHHHHDSTGGRQHHHHHTSGSAHVDVPDSIWLADSTTSYDPSPLASYLSPSGQYSTSGGTYASWRAPPTHAQQHARYQHGSVATDHQYSSHHAHAPVSHARATPYSPYFTLATAPSSYALTTAATSGPDAAPSQFSFLPAYTNSAAHQLATSAAPTETVSFTLSPLAAAAAAAATALAAADKTRHQHHHNHHAWTFTLPRLASTLAAQAVAPQLAAATTSVTPTQMATAGSNPSETLFHHPHTAYGGAYRPTSAAAGGGGPSYLFSPVPIYAIAPRPPGGTPLTSAASGTAASILPAAFHGFSPAAGGATTPTIIAYRPASMFSSAPLLTSFAYPFRLGPLGGGATYQPLTLSPSHLSGHHTALTGTHHHHHHSKPHSGHSGRGASAGSASSSSSISSLSLKPFIADLQWAESGSKSKTNNSNQNGDSTSSKGNSASFVKTTAGGLTQMARNLTKKMFGSASQVRPQFVAPPANFDLQRQTTLPAASHSNTVALTSGGISSSSPAVATSTAHYSPTPTGHNQQTSSGGSR